MEFKALFSINERDVFRCLLPLSLPPLLSARVVEEAAVAAIEITTKACATYGHRTLIAEQNVWNQNDGIKRNAAFVMNFELASNISNQ